MTNILDDPTLYLDSFLPTSPTPELSDFSDSLALLEQQPPTPTLTTPQTPTIPQTPTNTPFTALSDSELSSLLHDPTPDTDTNNNTSSSENESNSPTLSSTSNDTIIPSKRRRTTSSSFSTTYQKCNTPPLSVISLEDEMSGCSDCDTRKQEVVSRKQLEERLKMSAEENGRLRRRVADLVKENRGLRTHVEQLGQAATAMQTALQNAVCGGGGGGGGGGNNGGYKGVKNCGEGDGGGMMVGLATVSKEMAKQLGGMVVIGGKEKKRRRKKVGTAMACAMFVMAALVGIPDYLRDGSGMLALPGQSGADGSEHGLVPMSGESVLARVPQLCEYIVREPVKKAIADHSGAEKKDDGSLFVNIEDEHTERVLSTDGDLSDDAAHGTHFSYVLCKDSVKASASVESCLKAGKSGKECPKKSVISLIMPMPAGTFEDGMDGENESVDAKSTLAEVECTVSSVRRLVPRRVNPPVAGRVIATS